MIETVVPTIPNEKLPAVRSTLIYGLRKAKAYLDLTKPRITFEVVLIATFGYLLGTRGPVDYVLMLHTLCAVALLSSGISTLNQYLERHLDGLMKRTLHRPLPTRKVSETEALVVGLVLAIVAEWYLYFAVNELTAWLGALTAIGYVGIYTPLKTKSTISTLIGAFPGAVPPLIGWVAASGTLSPEAWALFAIMFFWQYPHFLAIAWMYREDYSRAAIKMLPVVEPDGKRTKRQILWNTLILLPLTLAPTLMHLTGIFYAVAAVVLGGYFLRSVLILNKTGTGQDARRVMKASVIYISILFCVMVIDKMTP